MHRAEKNTTPVRPVEAACGLSWEDFGLLEFRYELPPVSPRRFQLRVPVDYVTDTANPTGLTGPSSIYEITFDVGMPYGQEVLPVACWTSRAAWWMGKWFWN